MNTYPMMCTVLVINALLGIVVSRFIIAFLVLDISLFGLKSAPGLGDACHIVVFVLRLTS